MSGLTRDDKLPYRSPEYREAWAESKDYLKSEEYDGKCGTGVGASSEDEFSHGWVHSVFAQRHKAESQADRLRTAGELFDAVDWKVFCQLLCRADHNIEAIAINKLHAAYLKARDTK